MTPPNCLTLAIASALLVPLSPIARAADEELSPLQIAVACSPPATPGVAGFETLHVVGAQDTIARSLFGERDLLIIDSGTLAGVQLAQRYFVRRLVGHGDYFGGSSVRAARTVGWIRIIAANDTTAIAAVDRACDVIETGDYLEPFTAPLAPDYLDRVDRSGELDFKAPGHVLAADDGRLMASAGDFVFIDLGTTRGVGPGARFAIYRNVQTLMAVAPGAPSARLPSASVGEGVVVVAGSTTSVLRVLETHGAVEHGDYVVPRRP